MAGMLMFSGMYEFAVEEWIQANWRRHFLHIPIIEAMAGMLTLSGMYEFAVEVKNGFRQIRGKA